LHELELKNLWEIEHLGLRGLRDRGWKNGGEIDFFAGH
jgi:hypothetical protein